MALGSTYNDFFGFIGQVPNLAPNERYLPAADYGRVGALKLVEKIYKGNAASYVSATSFGGDDWAQLGNYHFYLLGRRLNIRKNDGTRAGLNREIQANDYVYPDYSPSLMLNGPHLMAKALEHLNESARIYGFNPSLVVGAFLTLVNAELVKSSNVGIAGNIQQDGFNVAKFNAGALESLWGQGSTGFPNTYRSTKGIAARGDYGGKGGGRRKGKRGKKRSRSMFF